MSHLWILVAFVIPWSLNRREGTQSIQINPLCFSHLYSLSPLSNKNINAEDLPLSRLSNCWPIFIFIVRHFLFFLIYFVFFPSPPSSWWSMTVSPWHRSTCCWGNTVSSNRKVKTRWAACLRREHLCHRVLLLSKRSVVQPCTDHVHFVLFHPHVNICLVMLAVEVQNQDIYF